MTTLAEALQAGQGIERPFHCHEHNDSNASASVNVVKGVWVCFACGARGVVDGKRVPTPGELAAMLEPETSGRVFPERWLELTTHRADDPDGYWVRRGFPAWVVRFCKLGEHPRTGEPTFPVYTAKGRLAGVGRRSVLNDGPRYVYPPGWSASRSLAGYNQTGKDPVLVLVEGAADQAALTEVGVNAVGCYGAGVHYPQRELIARLAPKLIVAGFDVDDAGEKAAARAMADLYDLAPVVRVTWPGGDPADTPPADRRDVLAEAVRSASYGSSAEALEAWNTRAQQLREANSPQEEESE